MQRYLDATGLTAANVMALGDGMNDFELLRQAGFAVAMANAKQPLLDAADFVTRDNDSDGVAHALEMFLLHG